MKINENLREYIENNIFPSYEKNDCGHNLEHIKYVIERSLKFASTIYDINYDMVYTIASYHDIGHYIDAKNHEKVSGDILFNDINLEKYFNYEQLLLMKDAIYDHRASLKCEPRSIYGKIVSSADRNVDVDILLKRTYAFCVLHNDNYCLDDIIIESRKHILEKFGKNGYARDKMYFEDIEYEIFLDKVLRLVLDDDAFIRRYILVNNVDQKKLKLCFKKRQ